MDDSEHRNAAMLGEHSREPAEADQPHAAVNPGPSDAKLDLSRYQADIQALLEAAASDPSEDADTHVVITVGDLAYWVSGADVMHIDFHPELTPLPGARVWVAGVCQSKGRVVIAHDLSLMTGGTRTVGAKLLVLRRHDIGLLAHLAMDPEKTFPEPLPLEAILQRSIFSQAPQASRSTATGTERCG